MRKSPRLSWVSDSRSVESAAQRMGRWPVTLDSFQGRGEPRRNGNWACCSGPRCGPVTLDFLSLLQTRDLRENTAGLAAHGCLGEWAHRHRRSAPEATGGVVASVQPGLAATLLQTGNARGTQLLAMRAPQTNETCGWSLVSAGKPVAGLGRGRRSPSPRATVPRTVSHARGWDARSGLARAVTGRRRR